MGDLTTIAIRRSTLKKLQKFRQYRRETYDEILNRLMDVVAPIFFAQSQKGGVQSGEQKSP